MNADTEHNIDNNNASDAFAKQLYETCERVVHLLVTHDVGIDASAGKTATSVGGGPDSCGGTCRVCVCNVHPPASLLRLIS